ncbi:MAG TPA: ribonuclease PH [Planctomycetes bacterium]|nr:ribonuclease PH [Planctomycetota bacterium]
MSPRPDKRNPEAVRPIRFERAFTNTAPGSVLASFGETRVLCTASWQDKVPPFLQNKGRGWLTAEYAMLPSSTGNRKQRDRAGKIDGRSVEIQRLIGRSLRAVIAFEKMTERTIWVDCDVLQADGGTRTVSISGAWLAVHDCLLEMNKRRILREWPLKTQLGAVSVGIVDGEPLCDLCYREDSNADVDMNLVMTGEGEFVEIQGSAEGATFGSDALARMLELGKGGIEQIFAAQRAVIEPGA